MARKQIKKYQIFWAITAVFFLWCLVLVGLRVWHVAHEPEKAVKEERRHYLGQKSTGPSIEDALADSAYNIQNIKEGKFTEKVRWPKVSNPKRVVVPVDNGDEKGGVKEPTKSYYGDEK